MSEQKVLQVPEASPEPIRGDEVLHYGVTTSPTIGKLILALAKAQLRFKPIVKQVENAAFTRGTKKSMYADLEAYVDATREALAKEELVLTQWPDIDTDAKSMTMVSLLVHSSNEWMCGRLRLPAIDREGFTAHTCAKAMTYARRYMMGAILGCAAEDDDGNEASGQGTQAAANEVAERKLKEFKDKKTEKEAAVSSLFYVWFDESQTAEITGSQELLKSHRDYLKPFWNSTSKTIVVNPDQLEEAKFHFEQLGVPFTRLKNA